MDTKTHSDDSSKRDEAQQDFIDGVLENGTIRLCSQQDGMEKCDEYLSSLDGSALDNLTGYHQQ